MNNYDILNNDKELNNIIDSINKVNENKIYVCHGRYHTTNVINFVEKILTELKYDKHTIELGKIAGLLHDIGIIEGKEGHAKRSSEMCISFLNKTTLSEEDKNIIIEAIANHSNASNITSPIGAALLIADKIDLAKDRVLELGKSDLWNGNLLNIEEVNLTIENNNIIINYIVNDKFSKEVFRGGWKKGVSFPISWL